MLGFVEIDWVRKTSTTVKPFTAMKKLSHINDAGQVQMVDVTDKAPTVRKAKARGQVSMKRATLKLLAEGRMAKGNVLTTLKSRGFWRPKKPATLFRCVIPWG